MSTGASPEPRSPLMFNTYIPDSVLDLRSVASNGRVGGRLVMVVDVQARQPLRRDAPTTILPHVALVIVAIAGVSGIAYSHDPALGAQQFVLRSRGRAGY